MGVFGDVQVNRVEAVAFAQIVGDIVDKAGRGSLRNTIVQHQQLILHRRNEVVTGTPLLHTGKALKSVASLNIQYSSSDSLKSYKFQSSLLEEHR